MICIFREYLSSKTSKNSFSAASRIRIPLYWPLRQVPPGLGGFKSNLCAEGREWDTGWNSRFMINTLWECGFWGALREARARVLPLPFPGSGGGGSIFVTNGLSTGYAIEAAVWGTAGGRHFSGASRIFGDLGGGSGEPEWPKCDAFHISGGRSRGLLGKRLGGKV